MESYFGNFIISPNYQGRALKYFYEAAYVSAKFADRQKEIARKVEAMKMVANKEPYFTEDETLASGFLIAALPLDPLPQEIAWASIKSTELPPIDRMPSAETVSDRFAFVQSFKMDKKSTNSPVARIVQADDMNRLGLPAIPQLVPSETKEIKGAICDEPVDSTAKANQGIKTFSILQHYGLNDLSLNKILATTAQLMDKMATQTAADCLMDMPSWMRNIYLARHGVPRLVGILLASRLEDAGESSVLASDGTVEAHNVVAPERAILDSYRELKGMVSSSSQLCRLTAGNKLRRPGVKIKNPNTQVSQFPVADIVGVREFGLGPIKI